MSKININRTINRFLGFLNNKFGITPHFLLLTAVFTVGFAVRIIYIGSYPAGLNQDEASIGYDAYAILNYGIDRNGIHLPVHLIAWGSGQNALYAYLAMPFIKIFGLTEFAVRLPNALAGCISLYVFYLLIKRILNKEAAAIGLFVLAVSPWHIMCSRWGLESNIFPPLFLAGVFFLVKSFEKNNFIFAAGFFFSLCLYSYGPAYMFIPLYLAAVSVWIIRKKKIKTSFLIASGILFVVISLPIALFVLVNYFQLPSISTFAFSVPRLTGTPRFNMVSSLFGGNLIGESVRNIETFLDLFAIKQHDGLIWNSIPGFGYAYGFCFVIMIFGFVCSFRKKSAESSDGIFVMQLWFILGLVIAVFSNVNINRINIIFFPAIFFTAFGLYQLRLAANLFYRTLIAAMLVFFIMFANFYFNSYQTMISPVFFSGLGPAIKYSIANSGKNETIYVTGRINMPYIYALFYENTSPVEFKNTVRYANLGAPFQFASEFGRYKFGECNSAFPGRIYVLQRDEFPMFSDGSKFTVTRYSNYAVAVRK
jgi:hypothetical protein